MGWTVESETPTQRIESCDHSETTEQLDGLASLSACSVCGKTWPTRFGKGAATTRIVEKPNE